MGSKPPKHWLELIHVLRAMRKSVHPPVDTMGCECIPAHITDPVERRFQILVSLMMSSQTKDTITSATMDRLRRELPDGLNVHSIRRVEPSRLDELIRAVGFHNRKTIYIKKAAEMIHAEYHDEIPATLSDLIRLPGVGPKMAHLCLQAAWNDVQGIGVDTHVHRIAALWKWTKDAASPEQTRMQLESWLPKAYWRELNVLMVGLGQVVCLPRGRNCAVCKLSNGLCPSAHLSSSTKRKLKTQAVVDIEDNVLGEASVELPVETQSTRQQKVKQR